MTSFTGSVRRGLWEIWKSKLVEFLARKKKVDFRLLVEAKPVALRRVRTWFGADGKDSIERWYLSLYVEKPFNWKVIKKFRIWTKKSSSVFRVSGLVFIFWIPDIGLEVRVLANGPGDLGSIPGRVIPKTQKMVLDASLLNTQHYKVRIKGKVEQSREGVAPSPTHWCSSYRKGNLRTTLDYGRQLYFTYVLCIYVMNILCTFHISVSWVCYRTMKVQPW